MQTILGSGGAIGVDLAKALTHYTDKIRLVSRNPVKINPDDELLPADLTTSKGVFKAVEDSEIVYVVIGFEYKAKVWEQCWPKLIDNVIEACKKYKAKLVFFDNMYMYDPDFLSNMTEDTPVKPVSRKGKVRAAIAQKILDAAQKGEIDALIARAPDFYGGKNSLLTEMVYKNLKKGKNGFWLGNPEKLHSFIYTPDAARATAMLGNDPEAYNQVWHLPTTHKKMTSQEWIELLSKVMGKEAKFSTMPKWMMGVMGVFVPVLKEFKEMVYQLENDYFFNSEKFQKKYDYHPIDPEEGMKAFVENYSNK